MRMIPHIFAALAAGLTVLSACTPRGPKDALTFAPVPEGARRLSFDVAKEGPQALDRALEQAVCLVLSSQYQECLTAPETPDVCNQRTRAQVDSSLRPTFTALRDTLAALMLTSPSLAKVRLAERLPQAVITDEVYDARRTAACREWATEDGTCLAIRTDSLWVLLRGGRAPNAKVQTVEVFLAPPSTCTDILPTVR